MKKHIKTILIISLLAVQSVRLPAQVSFGQAEKLNDHWRFSLNSPEPCETPSLDDGNWQTVDLPHDWSVKEALSPSLASCTGYLPGGLGWYRKHFDVPEQAGGKRVYLYFEGVYNRSEVFVNGISLGKRPNGYISFMYDATPHIRFGEANVVAVKVDHTQSADSRWYTGSGIYRDVWLVYAHPVHIAQWGVHARTAKVAKDHAVVRASVEVENGTDAAVAVSVRNELFYNERPVTSLTRKISIAAGGKSDVEMDLKVTAPALWSLDNPNLYQLKTTVMQAGRETDRTVTNVGIRAFTFDPDRGFALNGEGMKIKGVCIHHDAGVLGSAVPADVWRRRLLTLKSIGCNAIRTSHNPHAAALYDLCDELGLLVMDEAFDEWEFAKRKWLAGWNAGTPGFQSPTDFFEAWGERDLGDMVRRDRNHASVFAWSIGNEVDYPNDPYSHPVLDGDRSGFSQPIFGGYKKDAPDAMRLGAIAKRLVAAVKRYDDSRPVTAGLAGVAMSNETEYPGALDIAGYNYTESLYDADHAKYPARVIYGSENGHDLNAWKAVRDKDFIFGQFLWTGIDYLGESREWPSRGFYSGLMDLGGNMKPRGYFRQSLWSDKPMIYIGTYPVPEGNRPLSTDAPPQWNYAEGQTVRVVCYTNTQQAELLLNGKTAGETKPRDEQTGIIWWDVPYAEGTLEVRGMDRSGTVLATNAIRSSGRSHALKLASVAQYDGARTGRLYQALIEVVDENGVPVFLSDDEVTCRIDGPARLLGLEASNNRDMSDYTDNVHRVYHGKILVYILSTGEGEIGVTFSAPWLRSLDVRF
jgi:hypothetical protein